MSGPLNTHRSPLPPSSPWSMCSAQRFNADPYANFRNGHNPIDCSGSPSLARHILVPFVQAVVCQPWNTPACRVHFLVCLDKCGNPFLWSFGIDGDHYCPAWWIASILCDEPPNPILASIGSFVTLVLRSSISFNISAYRVVVGSTWWLPLIPQLLSWNTDAADSPKMCSRWPSPWPLSRNGGRREGAGSCNSGYAENAAGIMARHEKTRGCIDRHGERRIRQDRTHPGLGAPCGKSCVGRRCSSNSDPSKPLRPQGDRLRTSEPFSPSPQPTPP